jgi:mono/diheme cytochrome c family protein
MNLRRAFGFGLLLCLVAIAAYLAWAHAPSLPAADPPTRSTFAPAVVARGAELAALGDCAVCHTQAGGKAYAGGRALATPFGVIYGSNITPDPQSGIGQWSEAAFVRALRSGLDREGRHLYPAFPYDHFRLITDDDLHALYAFVMTRDAVDARPPPNRLRFPFNLRPLIAVWKALYLQRAEVPRDAAQGAAWQHGAYLVAGVAHCGACHTPRNRLGAERLERAFAGGEAEGWDAPALDARAPAPVAWDRAALHLYLRGAVVPDHGVAAGPMAPVVRDLARVPDADVQAIATYVATLGAASAGRANAPADSTPSDDPGRMLYEGSCAACHEGGRALPGGALSLSRSTALRLPSPRNLFRVILHGIAPADGERGPWMPGFAGALTDAQVTALARYLQLRFGVAPAWNDMAAALQEVARTPDERAVSGGP